MSKALDELQAVTKNACNAYINISSFMGKTHWAVIDDARIDYWNARDAYELACELEEEILMIDSDNEAVNSKIDDKIEKLRRAKENALAINNAAVRFRIAVKNCVGSICPVNETRNWGSYIIATKAVDATWQVFHDACNAYDDALIAKRKLNELYIPIFDEEVK